MNTHCLLFKQEKTGQLQDRTAQPWPRLFSPKAGVASWDSPFRDFSLPLDRQQPTWPSFLNLPACQTTNHVARHELSFLNRQTGAGAPDFCGWDLSHLAFARDRQTWDRPQTSFSERQATGRACEPNTTFPSLPCNLAPCVPQAATPQTTVPGMVRWT